MIQYIYFVKCPNCEDEPFDFFNDAKDFALGCMGQQPIITQVEVDRNDFGECTDSRDLGTVWSWEEMIKDEPVTSDRLSKKATLDCIGNGCYDADTDPEFTSLDNSLGTALDNAPDNFRRPARLSEEADEDHQEPHHRKPVPKGMTLKELVEAMEENEDRVECVGCEELYDKADCSYDENHGWLCPDCQESVVECTWCSELYDRSECRNEVDLGYLCSRCEAAIKSRGETLTFREGSYWDFLDEDTNTEDTNTSRLVETLGYDCPKLKEADINKPGIAKYKILFRFYQDQTIVPRQYAPCPYLVGTPGDPQAHFKGVELKDTTRRSYGFVRDLELSDSGEVILIKEDGSKISLRQALKIASNATLSINNTRTVLIALKNAAEAAERTLKPAQVRNLRVRNALAQLTTEVANELKSAVKSITFKIPPHNSYSDSDILVADENASETQAAAAAEKVNRIHDSFYGLPFVAAHKDRMENSGMIVARIPNEPAGWILSSWGPVGVITFNCTLGELSKEARDVIEKARVSGDPIDKSAKSVDCYRLATELISHFDNNPWFYLEQVEAEDAIEDSSTVEDSGELTEGFNSRGTVDFEYENLEITLTGNQRDADDWDEVEHVGDYTYSVKCVDVATTIWETFLTDEDVSDVPGGFDTLEDNVEWEKFLDTHFDALVSKYYNQLLEYYRDEAIESFQDSYTLADYEDELYGDEIDRRYDEWRDSLHDY